MLFKIFEKITEVSEKLGRVETRCEAMESDIKTIKNEDVKQNTLIAEHISGVQTNKARLDIEIQNRQDLETKVTTDQKITDDRLDKVEEPGKVRDALKRGALWITAIGGAIIIIMKLLDIL